MKIKYLDQTELSRLFDVIKRASVRDLAIFRLIYSFGLRVSELTAIRLEDLKPRPSHPTQLFIRRAKNGISRTYPIEAKDAKLIKSWLKQRERIEGHEHNQYLFCTVRSLSGPLANITVSTAFKRYCKLANIPTEKSHPHSLRHSTAVSLLSAGQDIFFTKEFLGHRSLASTLIYSAIMPQAWSQRAFVAVQSLAT